MEEDVKPPVSTIEAESASPAKSSGGGKDRIPFGALVLAKMNEPPRDKSVQVAGMVSLSGSRLHLRVHEVRN